MSVSAIGNASNLGSVGNVSFSGAENTQKNTTAAGGGTSASAVATAAATSSSSNVTTVVTLTDGGTVTTVRNKANEIVSISTTPPTRPASVTASNPSSRASAGGVNLLA